jgi:hypothetical protein
MKNKDLIAIPVVTVATGVAVLLQAKRLAALGGIALLGLGLNAAMRTAAEVVSESPREKQANKAKRRKRAAAPRRRKAAARA